MVDSSAPVPRHRADLVVPARLKDRVLVPGDTPYETARQVDNAPIDRRPAAIVLVRDVEDVRATLAFRSNLNVRPVSAARPG
jgi:hypothetical protein